MVLGCIFVAVTSASFRKGAVYVLILSPTLLITEPAQASVWQDLWYTSDQQGRNALEDGDAETAQLFFKIQMASKRRLQKW